MIIFIILLCCFFLGAVYFGYKRVFRLKHLNQRRFINGLLAAVLVLTLMSLAHWFGLFSQQVAAKVTMSAYTVAAGFFIGYGTQLILLRSRAGVLEFMYRSFWTDVAPNLISIALVVFGIYRTGVLDWDIFTGIGITSGLSLIGFGYLGWTVRIVPEFRWKGILLLDQFIEWKHVVAYRWINENTLQIDYYTESNGISDFKTFIPAEDQLIIERLLGKKLKEHEEERKQMMAAEGQSNAMK